MSNSRFSRRQILGGTGAATVLAGLDSSLVQADSCLPDPQPVATELAFRAQIELAVQPGISMALIRAGHVDGPRLSGRIIAGDIRWHTGANAQFRVVQARYTVRCEDGAIIHVKDHGHVARGRSRTAPEFETSAGRHDWLRQSLFVGSLDLSGFSQGFVQLSVYRVS